MTFWYMTAVIFSNHLRTKTMTMMVVAAVLGTLPCCQTLGSLLPCRDKGLLPSSCGQRSQGLERGDGGPELTEPPPPGPEPTGQLQATPHATHGLILLGTPGPSLPASQGSGETGDQDAPGPKYQT